MHYHSERKSANKSHETANMPNRCVVGGCSNVADANRGISLHFIPFSGDDRPEAKKRRQQWIDFVRLKRAKWSPTPNSSICSAHFAKEDFTGIFSSHSGKRPRLATDEIGIVALPKYANTGEDKPLSARAKRMVCIQLYCIIQIIYSVC